MSVEKNTPTAGTMDSVGAIDAQLFSLSGGKLFIAKGSYDNRAAFVAAVGDQTKLATELSTNYDELSDLAESPGKIGSKVELLKSKHQVRDGKRTNPIELNLAGISEDRKSFIEKDLNKSPQTFILVDDDKPNKIMCFNGLHWSGSWEGDIDKVFTAKLNTDFGGSTVDKIWFLDDIPAGA